MGMLIDTLIQNPMADITVFLSVCGALSFLVFLRGFLSGFPQLISMKMNVEHLEHARTRATWGLVLMMFFFLVWEVIRFLVGYL